MPTKREGNYRVVFELDGQLVEGFVEPFNGSWRTPDDQADIDHPRKWLVVWANPGRNTVFLHTSNLETGDPEGFTVPIWEVWPADLPPDRRVRVSEPATLPAWARGTAGLRYAGQRRSRLRIARPSVRRVRAGREMLVGMAKAGRGSAAHQRAGELLGQLGDDALALNPDEPPRVVALLRAAGCRRLVADAFGRLDCTGIRGGQVAHIERGRLGVDLVFERRAGRTDDSVAELRKRLQPGAADIFDRVLKESFAVTGRRLSMVRGGWLQTGAVRVRAVGGEVDIEVDAGPDSVSLRVPMALPPTAAALVVADAIRSGCTKCAARRIGALRGACLACSRPPKPERPAPKPAAARSSKKPRAKRRRNKPRIIVEVDRQRRRRAWWGWRRRLVGIRRRQPREASSTICIANEPRDLLALPAPGDETPWAAGDWQRGTRAARTLRRHRPALRLCRSVEVVDASVGDARVRWFVRAGDGQPFSANTNSPARAVGQALALSWPEPSTHGSAAIGLHAEWTGTLWGSVTFDEMPSGFCSFSGLNSGWMHLRINAYIAQARRELPQLEQLEVTGCSNGWVTWGRWSEAFVEETGAHIEIVYDPRRAAANFDPGRPTLPDGLVGPFVRHGDWFEPVAEPCPYLLAQAALWRALAVLGQDVVPAPPVDAAAGDAPHADDLVQIDEPRPSASPGPGDELLADVVLVGCVKSKATARSPAGELYRGQLWSARRRYAEARGRPWAIVSAGLGVVLPSTTVDPYERRIEDLDVEQFAAWRERARTGLLQILPRDAVIEVIAGRAYVEALAPVAAEMGARIVAPLAGMGIGQRQAWLAERVAQLDADGGVRNVVGRLVEKRPGLGWFVSPPEGEAMPDGDDRDPDGWELFDVVADLLTDPPPLGSVLYAMQASPPFEWSAVAVLDGDGWAELRGARARAFGWDEAPIARWWPAAGGGLVDTCPEAIDRAVRWAHREYAQQLGEARGTPGSAHDLEAVEGIYPWPAVSERFWLRGALEDDTLHTQLIDTIDEKSAKLTALPSSGPKPEPPVVGPLGFADAWQDRKAITIDRETGEARKRQGRQGRRKALTLTEYICHRRQIAAEGGDPNNISAIARRAKVARQTVMRRRDEFAALNADALAELEADVVESGLDAISALASGVARVESDPDAVPFLFWTGGKGRLLAEIEAEMPEGQIDYVEPFLGGGAVFLYLAAKGRIRRAILSEADPDIAHLWQAVKDDPDGVFAAASAWPWTDEGYAQALEAIDRLEGVARAGAVLRVNRQAHNGIWRRRKTETLNGPAGGLNMPSGYRKTQADLGLTLDHLRRVSELLQVAEIRCADAEAVIDEVVIDEDGPWVVYADPPYWGTWTGYDGRGFQAGDLVRHVAALRRLAERGGRGVMSNSSCASVVQMLESAGAAVRWVSVHRSFAPSTSGTAPEIVAHFVPKADEPQLSHSERFDLAVERVRDLYSADSAGRLRRRSGHGRGRKRKGLTVDEVARLHLDHPDDTHAQLAERAGVKRALISRRLRTLADENALVRAMLIEEGADADEANAIIEVGRRGVRRSSPCAAPRPHGAPPGRRRARTAPADRRPCRPADGPRSAAGAGRSAG